MTRVPVRYAHFIFAIMQAGITTAFATAIATFSAVPLGPAFLIRWLYSWMIAWVMIVPIVVVAAPFIRGLVERMTGDETSQTGALLDKAVDGEGAADRTL
jgi:membrane protein implicated in regulation of membrane protease activity